MARGFALGFGGKMGQQMWRDDCTGKSNGIRGTQVRVSALMGLAIGCFMFGLSILVPSGMRKNWMS